MSATSIEWATDVWNPVTGCDRVSPGCANCYALELAPRLRAMARARGAGVWQDTPDGGRASGPAFGVMCHPDRLEEPLKLGRRRDGQRRRIFVNSMSDLFHDQVPIEFIGRVMNVMGAALEHDFLILTKRPERMAALLSAYYGAVAPEPLPNVWLGVSIENRRYVGRADVLRATPAAVRFISAEPLLGPLVHDYFIDNDVDGGHSCWEDRYRGPELNLDRIDWVIVGGESGAQHRRIDAQWVRDLRDACRWAEPCMDCACGGKAPDAVGNWSDRDCERCGGRGGFFGPAFFFKQWGGRTPKAGGRELDGRTWDELPTARVAA